MKARKITRQGLANGMLARWRRVYGDDPNTHWGKVTPKLAALGDTPEPDAIDALIGNKSWTALPICDGCEADEGFDFVIEVGQEDDHDSATARLCPACLAEAATLGGQP